MEISGLGPNNIETFELGDLNYINIVGKSPYFNTTRGAYRQFVHLWEFDRWLSPHGFYRLGNTNVVNLENIVGADYVSKSVFFKDGCSAAVSEKHFKLLEDLLKRNR
ncbi:LytTR family transcriptional regulator DNA-binding domain-containing protein [Paenibacillus apiarius]|uniref:LytTR family transcriptional regulator DNA-binding domain-containing protein n=1 Tax=Paenibacillus apiarius TaxID=46240 RepID=UPI003B3AB945